MRALTRFAGVLVLLAASTCLAAAEQPGSPISIEITSRVGTRGMISADSAAASARAIVGTHRLYPEEATPVRYTDRASFGPADEGIGWLMRTRLPVTGDSTSAYLTANVLVDGMSGRVRAVFTDPGNDWVLPVWPLADADEVAGLHGWGMGTEIPAAMRSSAVEAISACWKQFDIDPTRTAQLIARPRWISPEFPAQEVDGKSVAGRDAERVWLIQLCGMKFHATEAGYDTGWVMQFLDGSLEFVRGFYVP